MKYRIWKESKQIKYRDVEADSEEKAAKEVTSYDQLWTTTDSGFIGDYFVTTDLTRKDGGQLFVERRMAETAAEIEAIKAESR